MPPSYLTYRRSKVGWKEAALKVGEALSSSKPEGYYQLTPEQWLEWALSSVNPLSTPTLTGSKLRAPVSQDEGLVEDDNYDPPWV